MTPITWGAAKSIALHALIVFGSVFGTTLAATGYSVSKAALISAVSAGATAAAHYLTGLLPNATATENRAAAFKGSAPPSA